MKIALNGFFLSRPFTGFGVHTQGLLEALSRVDRQNNYIIFVPEKVNIKLSSNFKIKVIKPIGCLGNALSKVWWEQWQIMKEAEKVGCQLVHHFYPVTSMLIRKIPQITSIHDAIPWCLKEYNYSPSARALRKFIKWSSHYSDLILTVSQTSAQDIIRAFKLEPDRVVVIYNGYNSIFDRKLKRSQTDYPYIFYLGGFDKRKNIRKLFFAYKKIAGKTKANLILAGGVFSPQRAIYEDYYALPKLIKKYRLQNRVKMIGPVENKDLPAFYQGAQIFVSPTFAEGFNIPVLEAFASGCPVACSNTSATKELAQDNALTFNPKKVEEIAEAMLSLLKNENLRKKYILRGKKRARDFSWDKSAKELLEVYGRFKNFKHNL